MRKLTLTRTADPNRSTAINFVHVSGRSLYIVDWLMVVVVEGGNLKREGNMSGENVRIPPLQCVTQQRLHELYCL